MSKSGWSLGLGIASFALTWFPFLGPILGIVGLVLGIKGLEQSKGMAITGIVFAVLGILGGLFLTWMFLAAPLDPSRFLPKQQY